MTTGDEFDFTLPDAGMGGDPRAASVLAGDQSFLLAVMLRDHYCPRCRSLVQELAEGYDELAGRSTALVAVLPDRLERAAVWHRRYDLPFSILADGASDGDRAGVDGEDGTAFDAFAPFETIVPHRPAAVLFEATDDGLRFVRTFGGDSRRAFPSVGELRNALDDETDDGVAGAGHRVDS